MSQSTVFQSCLDDFLFLWVEPVLSRVTRKQCLAQGHDPSNPSLTLYQLSHCAPTYRKQKSLFQMMGHKYRFFTWYGSLPLSTSPKCIGMDSFFRFDTIYPFVGRHIDKPQQTVYMHVLIFVSSPRSIFVMTWPMSENSLARTTIQCLK